MINGNTDDDFWIIIIFICYFRGGIVDCSYRIEMCLFMRFYVFQDN